MNVVFASGVLLPQHLFGIDYFRGAVAAFPQALFPPVPSLGDVAGRADALAGQINTAYPHGPIHIVAHSMGGLDARFLLSNNLCGLANPGRVASLSTISTPHWGSPIADLLIGTKPSFLDPRRIAYETLAALAARLGLSIAALDNLTTSFAAAFNRQNPDVGHVRYYCYAGSGMESFLVLEAFAVVHRFCWPDTRGQGQRWLGQRTVGGLGTPAEPAWNKADHWSEIGHSLSPTLASAFDHISAYRRVLPGPPA